MSDHDPFDFPCDVPIKVFGKNADSFRQSAVSIVRTHIESISESDVTERVSRRGSYVSLTIRAWIEDRSQIEAIYRDLHASGEVIMVL